MLYLTRLLIGQTQVASSQTEEKSNLKKEVSVESEALQWSRSHGPIISLANYKNRFVTFSSGKNESIP